MVLEQRGNKGGRQFCLDLIPADFCLTPGIKPKRNYNKGCRRVVTGVYKKGYPRGLPPVFQLEGLRFTVYSLGTGCIIDGLRIVLMDSARDLKQQLRLRGLVQHERDQIAFFRSLI